MALVIGDYSQVNIIYHYIQDTSILNLSYQGSRVYQLWSELEDIAIIIIILSPGCQQPFLIKMASDNRLSAAVFGPKWLVTTGCQQPLPIFFRSGKLVPGLVKTVSLPDRMSCKVLRTFMKTVMVVNTFLCAFSNAAWQFSRSCQENQDSVAWITQENGYIQKFMRSQIYNF